MTGWPHRSALFTLTLGAALLLTTTAIGWSGAVRSQPVATDDPPPSPTPKVDVAALERAYRAEPDDKRRAKLVGEIPGTAGGAELLTRIVATDASDEVALTAAHALRRATLGTVVGALERRLGGRARDATARERLLREIERHQVFAAGQNLPHFLREAPAVFTIKGDRKGSVRVLAFGDYGDGSDRQHAMAAAMRRLHARKPFHLAVTLGDNFYPTGMASPDDPRWERDFARLYEPMRIPFFPTLGNHDWYQTDSPAAEVLHSSRSSWWRMPAIRYTFVAGPVQFFAVDTTLVTRAQTEWLDRELGRSTARFKIVYGHHPVYSYGAHGDEPAVRDNLLPILRRRASLYLCGHEHDLQVLAPEDGVHFAIVGGGGATPRAVGSGPRTRFAVSKNGFAVIEANSKTMTFTLLDGDLRSLHSFTIGD